MTIIRPLCGLDNNLFNALEAAMNLEYPKYEVIFALQDERDEALPVVKLIMEKYPHVDSRIIISESASNALRKEHVGCKLMPQTMQRSASTLKSTT